MTNLEFIEKEIEYYKIIIYGVKTMLKEPHRTEDTITYLKNDLKEYEEKINFLQSIKNELEAWKVVKRYIDLNKEYKFWQTKPNYNSCILEEYQTVKKAMEVNNNGKLLI